MAAPQAALLGGAVPALYAQRITRGGQQHIGVISDRRLAMVHDAVLAHPGVADADIQCFVGAYQAQRRQQVIAVDRADRTVVPLAGPVHQQWVAGGDRVAIHQPQFAIDIVGGVDWLIECAEQRRAINAVVPEQVGGAHEGVARDLGTQQQLGLLAGNVGVRQQAVGGARQVVKDMFDMAEHVPRGGVAAGLHFPFDLPAHDRQAAHYRHHADHQR